MQRLLILSTDVMHSSLLLLAETTCWGSAASSSCSCPHLALSDGSFLLLHLTGH
jgi:hypothetical protein